MQQKVGLTKRTIYASFQPKGPFTHYTNTISIETMKKVDFTLKGLLLQSKTVHPKGSSYSYSSKGTIHILPINNFNWE